MVSSVDSEERGRAALGRREAVCGSRAAAAAVAPHGRHTCRTHPPARHLRRADEASLTGRAALIVREQVLEQLAAESLAPTACTTIEEVGSTGVGALTIAFLILGVSTIVFITRVGSAKGQKVYYYCNVFICGFATMAYFAMLSGQGWTAVAGCRQFFYARYVDWSVTTPLLLLDLGLIAGADGALIAAVIGADCKLHPLRPCPYLRTPVPIPAPEGSWQGVQPVCTPQSHWHPWKASKKIGWRREGCGGDVLGYGKICLQSLAGQFV
jgi:hypothetical protein